MNGPIKSDDSLIHVIHKRLIFSKVARTNISLAKVETGILYENTHKAENKRIYVEVS